MQIIPLSPTLTGAAFGGVMVRPPPALLEAVAIDPTLRTLWIVKLTLAPPIDNLPLPLRPTLLTERAVGPGVG